MAAVSLFCTTALEPEGRCSALNSVAVHGALPAAGLYENQISIGVTAWSHRAAVSLISRTTLNKRACNFSFLSEQDS